ncbi:MAG: putative SpoVG [Prokaryotic dsDNA virus sp.]|nr:MAG: putative SpoVG [Prokaryotic dsDNA virus sp.]|tara:strand:- start:7086 stop:7418 length:333 start_codon:yes stop_codon:yes gene_type:complete
MKITRMKTGSWGKLKAFFDLEVSGLTIKGLKLVEGINGLFVAMPSQQNKEGEYNDTVYAAKETKAEIEKVALKAYEKGDVQPKRMIGGMSEVDRIKNSNNYADKDEGVPF